jgi:molybdate transport system ATP-binding protein
MERMADRLTCECRLRRASGFALDANLSLPLDRAPITVLFGPSGSGKTTLLRMLAGLDRPDEGRILFRGTPWFDSARTFNLPPQQRRAGLVAQDYALFPHLTVAGNVAYAASPAKASACLATFGLTEFADRLPRALSSGQRQRVALARALAAEPALLLLDEPLSALDAATRTRTRQQLRHSLVAAKVPSIVVTHDRMEAAALGDWIAVMVDGRIRQIGPVQEVFQRPADAQVAESVGVENVLPASIVERGGGLLTLAAGPVRLQALDNGESGAVVACIRAEDIGLTREAAASSSVRNRIVGKVTSVAVEGPLACVMLDCGVTLVAVITAQSAAEMRLTTGDEVCAIVKATAVHLGSHD